jgi:hypothetical protein
MSTPSNALGPITWGLDFNFFQNVTPTASGSGVFNTNCDAIITFPTQTVTFWMGSGLGAGVVQYSFNGNTIHGTLDSTGSTAPSSLTFENRPVCKIWFTKISGSPVIRVEAWGTR